MQNFVNISIDDISPHPLSSTKVIDRCFELITIFPDIKFSLFIPISYWRTVRPETATTNPLQINLFVKFCDEIKSLPDHNFEVCYHGFYHGIPGKSDNDEFQHLNYDQAVERFDAMLKVVKMANLENKFKMIFRPPAWRMSPESIKAARDLGFDVLALSPKDYAQKIYNNEDTKKNDVVLYNCNPPFDDLNLEQKTEIVYHACEWDKNYLSKSMTKDLTTFLNKNIDNLEFCFMEGLVS